jgi:hypothetical protein
LAGGVKADEISELKQQLAEQNKLLQQMQQKLEELEAKQNKQDEVIEQKVTKVVEEKKLEPWPGSLDWVKKVKISGDLRYRHESIDEEGSDRDWDTGVNRHRIRARIKIEGKVNDDTDVIFRLASGTGDPVSTNQTLENSFSQKAIWIDQAYFNWHPAAMKGLNVYGGKMANPFYNVGGNQLIWDGDLNPEGIAAGYVMPLGKNNTLHLAGGGFWVDESSGGVDTSLWAIQAYLKHIFEDKSELIAGASHYNYGNIKGRGDLKTTWAGSSSHDFFGNTTSGSMFASDFDLIEGFAEYNFAYRQLPLSVYGNYVKNCGAATSEDTGWLIGCKVNRAKDPGSWEFSYDYRSLQKDAVLGALSDSDFIGGGTDGKGHRFGLMYQLAKNWQFALTYFLNKEGDHNTDYRRLQADLVFKF